MTACILWRSWCGLRPIFCPCSKWLRITQRPNLGISTTHISDSSKSRTTRKHNNDRKLRSREIIQQDDGKQYETRSYIIRNVCLFQSLKGEPTRRGVPYVRIQTHYFQTAHFSIILPSKPSSSQWSLPITCSHQQQCPM